MKKAHLVALGAVIAILALSGCSAGSNAAGAISSPSPSPTKDGDRTLSQWASVVAEQTAYLAAWKQKWDADLCSAASGFNCSLQTLSGTFVATTVNVSLKIPESKTAIKGYIGTPPSEIRSLYADTRRLAQAADDAGAAWVASCNAKTAPECATLLFKFSSAVDSLETKFTAWSPYL
jgi:hypothetical protein